MTGRETALVTGAGGLLAHALVRELRRRGVPTVAMERGELDVTRAADVSRAVAAARPTTVLHCAAYTAVDRAESDEFAAFAVNETGTANVARAAAAAEALVVYPSTDYVFSGDASAPYRPGDPTGPLSVYGRSKLAGEHAVRGSGACYLIVRTSWLFGPGGRDFVDAVIARSRRGEAIRVVHDQTGSPTWTMELAPALLDLASSGHEGVFHLVGGGRATWWELACEALRLDGSAKLRVEPVTTEEYGAPAPRPRRSVLDTSDAEAALGRALPCWRESLAEHLGVRGGQGSSR